MPEDSVVPLMSIEHRPFPGVLLGEDTTAGDETSDLMKFLFSRNGAVKNMQPNEEDKVI